MLSDLSRTPTSNPSVTKVTQLTHYFCLAPPSTTSQPLPSFLRMTPDCRSLFLNSYISDPQTKRSSNVPKMSSHQNSEAQIHYSRTSLYDQNNIRIRSFSHLRLCGHEEIWKNVGNIKNKIQQVFISTNYHYSHLWIKLVLFSNVDLKQTK